MPVFDLKYIVAFGYLKIKAAAGIKKLKKNKKNMKKTFFGSTVVVFCVV